MRWLRWSAHWCWRQHLPIRFWKGKRHHQIRIFHDPKHLADYLILALRVLAIGSLIGAWIRHADRASTIQDVIDQEAREKDDGVAASHVGAVHLEEPRHY